MTQRSVDADPKLDADSQRGHFWFIFLAGPVAYSVYFLVVWALGEFGCLAGIQQLSFFGLNPIYLGVVALTVVAALATLTIGVVSFRHWRQLREGPEDPDEDDPKFMSFVGIWLNGLFTVAILMSAIPMLFGSACTWI